MANTGSPLAQQRVLLVSAFDPWAVGNGSSMRAHRWCEAAQATRLLAQPEEAAALGAPSRELVRANYSAPTGDAAMVVAAAAALGR